MKVEGRIFRGRVPAAGGPLEPQPRSELCSSDGYTPPNFQPQFIHGQFIPICLCANAVLQLK